MDHRVKENRLRGSSAFPFVLYEMPYGDTSLSAAMHWQDDVEVLLINRGDLEVTLDGAQMILHAGDMAWVNPGQLHGFQELTQGAQCDIFIFPIQHLLFEAEDHDQQNYLRPLAEGKIGFPARVPENGAAYGLLKQIIVLHKERPAAYEMLTKALLLQLISHLAQTDSFVPLRPAKHDDVCKQILLYIQQHYAEKITVTDIAEAVAVSPTYFSAFFMKHFFQRFTDYLRGYRIEQACAMLTGSSMSVTEIALAAGFNSGSHFIANFREVKGVTPLAYRKMWS